MSLTKIYYTVGSGRIILQKCQKQRIFYPSQKYKKLMQLKITLSGSMTAEWWPLPLVPSLVQCFYCVFTVVGWE